MAQNIPDGREAGRLVLLGGGVVFLTPLVNGFVSTIGFLQTQIPALNITVGTALSAGVAAFAMEWAISRFMKKG